MKIHTQFFGSVVLLLIIYSTLNCFQQPLELRGTLWKMHLVDSTYSYKWLNCDSTYIEYDAEIEGNFYGTFDLGHDTLILNQKYEDDFHKHGDTPVKVKSLSKSKYSIQSDSTIIFLERDGEKAKFKVEYAFEKRFNCEK